MIEAKHRNSHRQNNIVIYIAIGRLVFYTYMQSFCPFHSFAWRSRHRDRDCRHRFYCISISTFKSSLGHIQFAWSIRNGFLNVKRSERIKLFTGLHTPLYWQQPVQRRHPKNDLKIHYMPTLMFLIFQISITFKCNGSINGKETQKWDWSCSLVSYNKKKAIKESQWYVCRSNSVFFLQFWHSSIISLCVRMQNAKFLFFLNAKKKQSKIKSNKIWRL